jgi:hypothetical protein
LSVSRHNLAWYWPNVQDVNCPNSVLSLLLTRQYVAYKMSKGRRYDDPEPEVLTIRNGIHLLFAVPRFANREGKQMQTQTISLSSEIDAYILKSAIPYRSWYVGITADIPERLFGYHQVSRENAWWIYRRCPNATEARALEAAYHKAGCKGAGGGGDWDSIYIYAYVITPSTLE